STSTSPIRAKEILVDAPPGGTTAIVVNNEDRTEIVDYVTSSGTLSDTRRQRRMRRASGGHDAGDLRGTRRSRGAPWHELARSGGLRESRGTAGG
ncbi:MAG TPA: hypothetical protein VFY57_00580, partial [Rubrobacteraceae bacterium]|nr:hypothetical protein [Rubrobacteraceae bacterium]